jgi:hypothetical protein
MSQFADFEELFTATILHTLNFSFCKEGNMSDSVTRYDLSQTDMLQRGFNIQADLPRPLSPVLHPGTHQPVGTVSDIAQF